MLQLTRRWALGFAAVVLALAAVRLAGLDESPLGPWEALPAALVLAAGWWPGAARSSLTPKLLSAAWTVPLLLAAPDAWAAANGQIGALPLARAAIFLAAALGLGTALAADGPRARGSRLPAAAPATEPVPATRRPLHIETTQLVAFFQDDRLRYLSVHNPPPWLGNAVGRTDVDLLSMEDAAGLTDLKRRVLEMGVPVREEVEIAPAGQALVYDVALDPQRDAAGAVCGVAGYMIDVTARRRAVESLLSANDELESQVRALSDALARAAEREARRPPDTALLEGEDPLTGLPGPRLFNDRLAMALVHARRHKQTLAVVEMAVDGMAGAREKLGTALADDVVCGIATLLQQVLRQGDTVARLDGDAFTLLLEVHHDEDVARVAEKLRAAMQHPMAIAGRELPLTASLGFALYPEDGPEAEALLHAAREALDQARSQGGDGYVVHAPQAGQAASRRSALEASLRRALVQGDLELLYQPVGDCETGALQHVEALLRLRDAERHLVPAGQFIEVADAAGLAVPLGQWALRAACAQAKAWLSAGLTRPLAVAVNLSGHQFAHPSLVQLVRRALQETPLPSDRLILEIAEAELMKDPAFSVQRVADLRALGVRVAVDDFGVAVTSLELLSRLAVTSVKLDRSVVRGVGPNPLDGARARAGIALAHALGLKVVAVGVETEEQRVLLERLGCDLIQGHLCGPPIPASDCEAMFQRQQTPTLPAQAP